MLNVRTVRRFFYVVLLVGVVALTVPAPGPRAQPAQESCPSFHALIQARLFPDDLLRPEDVWGGDIAAYLGQEFFHGYASMNDGTVTYHGKAGMGSETSNLYDFGNGNTLIVSSTHSTFPGPGSMPVPGSGGSYQAAGKIVSGTGRFQYASGNVYISGPALVWDLDKLPPRGRWNGEIKGNICGVQ